MFTIDLCLLCLKNDTNLKSILSKDRDDVIVKEKLKCFLSNHIKLEPEDSMLYICLPCLKKLNNVYNYKQLCLWNINRFNIFIQKLKSTDETYRNLRVTLTDIKNISVNIVTCGNELNSDSTTTIHSKIDNVTVHKDQNEDETKQRQKTEVVGEISKTETNEMRYINNISHNIKNNNAPVDHVFKEEVVPKNVDGEIKYEFLEVFVKEETIIDEQSELCNTEIIKEETEGNNDIIDEKSELYNNEIVDEETEDNNYDSIDEKLELYKNEIVEEETEDNNDIIHEKSELYNDDNNEDSTSIIGPRNTNKKSHKCNECHKSFTCLTYLIQHNRRIQNGDKPFACDVCDKAYYDQSTLVRHKLMHSGTKPYRCDVCNKTFRRRDTLMDHKFSHTGEKPYKCDQCHKAFIRRFGLVKHKRTHTGERPFKCDLCDKTFTDRYGLARHKLCHTGERAFKCDECDKTFPARYKLVNHKRCHT